MEANQSKRHKLTLSQYVEYRNGVPLGAPKSLENMLKRSLGAGSFAQFWQYWNPIWGYALGRYIYSPLNSILPASLALVLTFTISGVIHDLATMLVRGAPAFLFTPWFFLMSLLVLFGRVAKFKYSNRSIATRVFLNLTQIIGCLIVAIYISKALLSS